MASYSQSLIRKALFLSKYMLAGLGLMLLLSVGSSTLSCIFLRFTFFIVSTAYFTLFFSQNPKHCEPNHKNDEEVSVDCKDDQCITSNVDEDDHGSGLVSKSWFLSKEDGYISDEDTLIEIELPTGQFLSSCKDQFEQNKLKFSQKLVRDYYSYKRQQTWVELLSEEDNLIEIDISIGSIMCPRFEIEAPLVL